MPDRQMLVRQAERPAIETDMRAFEDALHEDSFCHLYWLQTGKTLCGAGAVQQGNAHGYSCADSNGRCTECGHLSCPDCERIFLGMP